MLWEGVGDAKVGLVEFEDLRSLLEGIVSVVQNVRVGTYTDLIVLKWEPTVYNTLGPMPIYSIYSGIYCSI